MGNASAGGLAYVTAGGGAGGGVDVVIGGNTAGATASVSSGTLFLAGGPNITLSQNGQSISVSAGAGGGASTAGIFATGNTTNNSTTTVALSSQLFNFQGGVTGGFSAGSIQISAPSLSSLSNSNNVSFGTNGSTITASYALAVSAGGGTSNALSGITFTNSNNVSFGLSTGAGVGTITASIATTYAGTGATFGSNGANKGYGVTLNTAGLTELVPVITRLIWPNPRQGFTQISAPGNASLSIVYVPLDCGMLGTRVDALVAMSAGSAATNATAALVFSAYAIIYSRTASTLTSMSSGSTQTTYTYASNTAGQTQLTNSAIYPISVPMNFTMNPGEYFVGFNIITNTSSIGLTTTNLGATISMMGAINMQTALNYAEITANTASSTNLFAGMGMYTAATTGAPVSVGLASIAQTGVSLSQANIALVFRQS